ACHCLAPYFRRQAVFWWGRGVPVPALAHVIQPGGDVLRQWKLCAVSYRWIDVTVGVFDEQIPQGMFALEGNFYGFPCLIEQERNHRIFADVLGDVFFGVVRAHLLLVDVLLEDV